MSETMRERLKAFWERPENRGYLSNEDATLAFAEAEVRAALAPREQSPELAEAVDELAFLSEDPGYSIDGISAKDVRLVLAEIDRLHAENARLKEPPAPLNDATLAKLALVCPKGAKELAHLRRENARQSAEVERLRPALVTMVDESVQMVAAFTATDTGPIQTEIDSFENALREARSSLAATPPPAQDGDRATRVFVVGNSEDCVLTYLRNLLVKDGATQNISEVRRVARECRAHVFTITAERAKETGRT